MGVINCFGGGIFFGTYLLHMAPEVRMLLEVSWLKPKNIIYPYPELFMGLGFFLVLYLEKLCKFVNKNGGEMAEAKDGDAEKGAYAKSKKTRCSCIQGEEEVEEMRGSRAVISRKKIQYLCIMCHKTSSVEEEEQEQKKVTTTEDDKQPNDKDSKNASQNGDNDQNGVQNKADGEDTTKGNEPTDNGNGSTNGIELEACCTKETGVMTVVELENFETDAVKKNKSEDQVEKRDDEKDEARDVEERKHSLTIIEAKVCHWKSSLQGK